MPTSVNSQLNNLIAEFIGGATHKRVIHWLIKFWFDIRIGSTLLEQAFTRIFALARKKVGNIHEFGSRVGNHWQWSIPLRRPLFDWELQVWDDFQQALNSCITSLSSTICALCLDEEESVHHLFVRVGSLEEFGKTGVLRGSEPVWNMSFFAIAWTIWLHLNEVVFNAKLCDLDQFYDLTVVRIGWCYAEWPGSVASTYEFLLCSPSFSPPCKPNMNISNCQWRPTPPGCLKFNVDGAISG
ncbi:hypothetical protein PVK06_031424 [Gossypium arboreum]|uniref:Uncharacterized protein n=1 Tax=Gossypium arboreum TaxID=29729 RepID=A0ABR0NR94_GOSAR|nr:hypothetical protein PVK06_031424 [Gossypium arboreum]